MTIKTEVLDELLSGCTLPDDLLGEEGVFKQLTKALLERMLRAELTAHLAYEKGCGPRYGEHAERLFGEDGADG